MSKRRQKFDPRIAQIEEFYRESRRVFGEQYRATGKPSILVGKDMLENSVEQGGTTPAEGLLLLRKPNSLAEFLLKAEQKYQKSEDQKLHKRMATLERNTDWKAAAIVSFGAGMVTGLICAAAGPFFGAWLQPTADEMFKRQPAAQASVTPQPQIVQNITNNNAYNFCVPETKADPAPLLPDDKKPKVPVTCKNVTIASYRASLPELLQRGNIVTLEMNGKKVSVCYRPDVQHTAQPQTLSKK